MQASKQATGFCCKSAFVSISLVLKETFRVSLWASKKTNQISANSKPLGVFCNSKVEDRLIQDPGQLSRSSQQDIFSEFTIVKRKGPPLVNLKEIFLTQLKRVFNPSSDSWAQCAQFLTFRHSNFTWKQFWRI